ncbi:MAG: hypothetical protein QM783_05445 [Phycisphaerales bacterium]
MQRSLAWRGGPINPPAGAVGSTGRTLDEIYDKIPSTGASDGRIPIAGGTTSVTLSEPGSYVLTGNLRGTAGTNAVTIQSDDVDLDLNGFVITSSSATLTTVVAGGFRGVRVRNGVIREGYYGLDVSLGIGWTVENMRFERCRWSSIRFNGGSGHVIRACMVLDTGAITLASDSLNVNAVFINGSGAAVSDTTVFNVINNGSGGRIAFAVGASTSLANSLSRCTAAASTAVVGIGISVGGTGGYRDCTVGNFAVNYSGGTSLGGNL